MNAAVEDILGNFLGEETADYDWAALLGDKAAVYVEAALAKVAEALAAEGLEGELDGVDIQDVLMGAIEAYAYNTVSYTVNLPKVIAAIRAINPTAVVVVVGMHNPLNGTTVAFEGQEIEVASYLDELVNIANVYGTALCLATDAAIFVKAPEVETYVSDTEMGVIEFILTYMFDTTVLNPTEAGQEYIKDQILNALTVKGLLGDVNTDGKINAIDAMVISQYYVGLDVEINLNVADVNGDDKINAMDAMLISQYYVGIIAEFPAA